MYNRVLWSMFTDTGEPMCWLLLRAENRIDEKDRVGEENRPQ